MCVSGLYTERFGALRRRITKHIGFVLKSNLFGKVTKVQAVVLWLFPHLYKRLIKLRGEREDKKFAELTGADNG